MTSEVRIVEGVATVEDVTGFVDELGAIGRRNGAAVQAFDARYVAGREHLHTAVERANRAFERDDAIADDRAVEILCYAAARRQINRAMEMGVSTGEQPAVVVVEGGDEAAAASEVEALLEVEDVLGSTADPALIGEFFDIGQREREATEASLEELVVERVSLLVVEK